MVGEHRVLVAPRFRVLGKPVQVDHGWHQGDAAVRHLLDHLVAHAGAVFDAVDPGRHQFGYGLFPEAVGGDPGALLVGNRDRLGRQGGREGGFEIAR